MKGAIAEPCANTSKAPNATINKIIGASQNFFRSRINIQRSFNKSIIFFPFKFFLLLNSSARYDNKNRLERSF